MFARMNLIADSYSSTAIPLPVSTSARYSVRQATTSSDIRAAQKLRFEIFNLELDKGLDASYASGLDVDPFDDVCDHLLVYENASGDLAGTYRIQTGLTAAMTLGYYSEQEFSFEPYEGLRPQMIELGRACVHRRHRNLAALGVLWKAIAVYAKKNNGRYLIGCSSLTSAATDSGWAVYSRLAHAHLAPPAQQTIPLPGWECPAGSCEAIAYEVPKLMQAYLALGAKICAPPAWDRQFGTIDFLTMLDLEAIHPSAKKRFLE